MPRIKSSLKDVRRTKRRRIANRTGMSRLKSALRKVHTSPAEQRGEALKQLYQTADKAAGSGLIHRKTASRYKSRMAKLVQAAAPKTA